MFKWYAGITIVGLALGGLLLTGTPAAAQSGYAPKIDQREAYQQQRIQQGIGSGALTPGETRYLEKEQARIQAAEQRMKADGHLSPWERQRLREMQNQASQDIYRLEHNNRTTAGWGGNNYQGWSGHTNSARLGNNYSGWGRGGYAWQGNNTGGNGTTASGNTTPGNPQNPQGWRGNGTYGSRGNNTGGSGTTASNTQGQQGNYYRNGQSGAFQQPGTRPQSQQQYQQARSQTPQPTIRPNASMMPRQPTGLRSMANRASYSAPRAALRRR